MAAKKSQELDKIKEQLASNYDYLSEDEISQMIDMAIADYLAIRYPSYESRPTNDDLVVDFFVAQWLYKRAVDIIQRLGVSSFTSYSENGLRIEFAKGSIDSTLVAQIMPKAGVPR